MKTAQWLRKAGGPWKLLGGPALPRANAVLLFGAPDLLREPACVEELRALHPQAHLLGCSTAGEICGDAVTDDTAVATALELERTEVRLDRVEIKDFASSREAGRELGRRLARPDLVHVFVLSDGLAVNGSELVGGLRDALPPGVTLTGGLSADGDRFRSTLVVCDGPPLGGAVAALGFYGDRLLVGCGSMGGWDPFGPERVITRSEGNVLHELDGRPALDLYRRYLGSYADDLPASALLFPLLVRSGEGDRGVVRTILGLDAASGSMTFAGDMPQGAYARLMKANFDRLIDGAMGAARINATRLRGQAPQLAILISCVGRKLVLKQRTEEEVEAVREVLGADTVQTGFYSYGELSPGLEGTSCELHNQTMTITTLTET